MKQCCPSEWGMDEKCWEPLIEVSRFFFIILMPATLMKGKRKHVSTAIYLATKISRDTPKGLIEQQRLGWRSKIFLITLTQFC